MQIDWDLIQEILEAYEQDDPFDTDTIAVKNILQSRGRGGELNEARYHHVMLEEAGCLAPTEQSILVSSAQVDGLFLTLKGHELLEDLRNGDLPDAPRSRQF